MTRIKGWIADARPGDRDHRLWPQNRGDPEIVPPSDLVARCQKWMTGHRDSRC